MDYNSAKLGLLSFEQALSMMLTQVTAKQKQEIIPLSKAVGRITANVITSPINIPLFDHSAMDGYAVRINDISANNILPVIGKAFAGAPYQGEWPAGTCIRIMTGAAIPEETQAVIMQEQVEIVEEGIRINSLVVLGQNIRRVGEELIKNTVILKAGTILGPIQLSLLASLSIEYVSVFQRLKITLFSTGDELQSIGKLLKSGQIYDTNRLAIKLMLEKMGAEVIDFGIIPDDKQAIRKAFTEADKLADLVISSGGVSVGDADYVKETLAEIGNVAFWKLAIKPGKPFAFGQLKNAWFCGLPGNPVSAVVTFYQLVQPLINNLSGIKQELKSAQFRVRTLDDLQKSVGRLDFQRGILAANLQGELEVRTTGNQGSHMLSSFNQANCFIILEATRGFVAAGEMVTVEPFNCLLRH